MGQEGEPWRIRRRFWAGSIDGIEYRGFEQSVVEELAKYSRSTCLERTHRTWTIQLRYLADLLTIEEHIAKPLQQGKGGLLR